MRRKLIEADLIECVLGLGPNLFYNSPMEACVVVCRTQKPKASRGKILFINAVNEVTRERAQSFLTDEHLQRVVRAYQEFKDEPGFTRVATLEEIRSKDGNLSIPLYVETETNAQRDEAVDAATTALPVALASWIKSSLGVRSSVTALDDSSARASVTIPKRLTASPAWASLPLFDRSGWKRVRFGDVVENCAETCDPAEAGLERFVAMEHLEPGSLHVRAWGNVADGTTFTRRCRPGQVLFGKRRAYQRKVAVAEFEAVVSGDIYVLAPKDTQRLLPELLPFLCLSERFFQHAVGTSAGSLSPRTNWSSLASFEFDLPSLDQQRRIAEILWAVDETSETLAATIASAENAVSAFSESVFGEKSEYASDGRIALGGVCKLQSGYPFKSSEFVEDGDRLLRGSNVGVDRLDWRPDITKCFPSERRQEVADFILKSGDIVVAMDRPFISEGFKIARVTESDLPVLLLQRVGRFQPTDRMHAEFLWLFLHSESFQRQLKLSQQGTDLPHISRFDIESTKVVVPSLEIQKSLMHEFASLKAALKHLKAHSSSCSQLTASIVNSVVC